MDKETIATDQISRVIHSKEGDQLARKFQIKIDDSVFFAFLMEDKSPKTCKAFLSLLPLEGKILHATWSGEMLFLKCNGITGRQELENATVYPSRGDVGLNFNLGELQIVYGQAQLRARLGPAPDSIFARITENPDRLEEMGQKIHREGAKNIVIKM